VVEPAKFRTFEEFGIDLIEEYGKSKGGEEGTEGVALSKALILDDGVPSMGRGTNPRSIGVGIKDVEETNDG
jgi:hypothetical protein